MTGEKFKPFKSFNVVQTVEQLEPYRRIRT